MNGRGCRIAILAGLILFVHSASIGQTVTDEWVRSDADGYPYGTMIAMDSQENVVVTGWRYGSYIVTKKYGPDGDMLWERHFSVPDLQAVATWVLVDAFDNVVITGYPQTFSSNPVEVGLLTIKYDGAGNLLWSDTYSGTWAFAVRGISDADGNVYVAGRAWFGTYDFVTIKYAPDGTRLWVDTFDQNGGFHTPNSMDLDSGGNLIINGGGLSGGFLTVLYDTDGVRQWVLEGLGNKTNWVKLTGDGYFYLTGGAYHPSTSNDIWLLKYDLSKNLIWEKSFDFGVTSEYGTLLTLDSQGNIIVAGHQGVYMHWITLKADPQGTLLWSHEYTDNPYNDAWPSFLMTGPEDEVYVTGVGGPPPDPCCSYRSMATLRYNSDGSNPWKASYYVTSQRGVGLALASDNSLYAAGDYMLTVIKYAQNDLATGIAGGQENDSPGGLALLQNSPNPFNPRTTIAYELPGSGPARLRIFDLRGRVMTTLVDETVARGRHEVTWDGRDAAGRDVPSGVYFSRLEAGGMVVHGRMTLAR